MNPPSELERLCKDMGIGPNQLANLRKDDAYKDEQALIKAMQKWWKETRDEPRLLGKTTGYVHTSAGALRVVQRQDLPLRAEDAGEAVDEVTQRRYDAQARAKQAKAAQEVVLAAESVRAAIRERAEQSEEFRKQAGRSLYRITAELDRVVKNAKRRAA